MASVVRSSMSHNDLRAEEDSISEIHPSTERLPVADCLETHVA